MKGSCEMQAILRRAAAMAEACGLGGVDASILLCSLLSLKGDEIERAIYSRRIKNELYEDAKRLVGRSGGVGEVLKQAKGIEQAEAREISAIELFCLIGLATSLTQLYQAKGLSREMLAELLASSRANLRRVVEVGDPIADLEGLIGLGSVKDEVRKLVALIKFNAVRQARGLPAESLTNNFVFTGNPGTGKTTVARILARIYAKLGVLKRGHLVEVGRADLVAGYVGQSAERTKKVIESALDGVLFIDEAYTLAQGGHSDYGQEVIATLVQEMERWRERLVVVVAGYGDEMHKFVGMNPGLQSRFTKYIDFPDYTAEELLQVFRLLARKNGYVCSDMAEAKAKVRMDELVQTADRHSGNARAVRNLFGSVKERMATRVVATGCRSKDCLVRIEEADIP